MSKLRESVLGLLQEIGDRSGCHQLPERSFHIKGYTFPVCARCSGVFLGEVLAVLLWLCGIRIPYDIAAGLLLVMGLDWLIQRVGWIQSTNIRRLLTGISGGLGLFGLYFVILDWLFSAITNLF